MKLKPSSVAIKSILVAAISLPTTAALADGHEQRQLEAHVHGVTTLNIAFENGVLDLELEGPGMNFVGFEHAPRTDEQKQAIANALEVLKGDGQLFRISPGAGCTLVKANSEHIMEGAHEEDHDDHDEDHHDSEHHDHDKDHDDHEKDHHEHESDHGGGHDEHGSDHDEDHEEHDDHDEEHGDHDHEHDHEGGAQHSEFVGQYQFRCAQPDQLTELRVALFERFPRTEEVEASFIGPDLQTFKSLTPADPVLKTRR